MITLAKHIELLLLEHDCVIVPGLGGFIANHAEARYTGEEEYLMLPPYRTIGFNQQLQVNDGLLVQSYMAAYDTSYPAAHLQMEQDLEKMMRELDMTGKYELENIGTLQKDLNRNISLTAFETGALTPSLYGLYSYEIKSLSQVLKEKKIERNLQAAAASMHISTATQNDTEPDKVEKEGSKHIVIRLSRRWLDVGIAAAAAIVLLFCISYPALKISPIESDTVVAAFTPIQKVEPIASMPAAKPVQTEKTDVAKPEVTESKTAEKPEVTESKPVETPTSQPQAQGNAKFAIVLASYVNQKNAETFIELLKKNGYKDARFVENGKTTRILYSGYVTREDAQAALGTLRKESTFFSDGWILEL